MVEAKPLPIVSDDGFPNIYIMYLMCDDLFCDFSLIVPPGSGFRALLCLRDVSTTWCAFVYTPSPVL